ncbi:MAG: hypothetical protein ACJ8EB_01510 [Allosphingosinicella sp.]
MSESDADYYARRAVEEARAADRAADADAAAVHRKLAEKYRSLAQMEEARRPRPAMRNASPD